MLVGAMLSVPRCVGVFAVSEGRVLLRLCLSTQQFMEGDGTAGLCMYGDASFIPLGRSGLAHLILAYILHLAATIPPPTIVFNTIVFLKRLL